VNPYSISTIVGELYAVYYHRQHGLPAVRARFQGGIAHTLVLTQGNLGTLVRHRGMPIPFVLVLTGARAASLWSRRRARRSATSVMRLDHLTSRLMNPC
jgi:nucleoside-diphosphate-sugar epimerase